MSKLFFDHLLPLNEIFAELDRHTLDPEERAELVELIDQQFHHHTLNIILNHLPEEHHHTFIVQFTQAPHHPDLLEFVKHQVKIDIEAAIKVQADRVKREILAEIKKAKLKK